MPQKKESILNAYILFRDGYGSKSLKSFLQNKNLTSKDVNSAFDDYIIGDGEEDIIDKFINNELKAKNLKVN